jgi:aldehyde:ferredoxin oxidoreductase
VSDRPLSSSNRSDLDDVAWSVLLDLWLELRTESLLPEDVREAAAEVVHEAMVKLAVSTASRVDDVYAAIAESARLLATMPDTHAYVMAAAARDDLRRRLGRRDQTGGQNMNRCTV